jgi:hypothetical protein
MAPGNDPDQAAQELLHLAWERFGNLSEAEAKLLRAAPKGEEAARGPSPDFKDPANDPAKADDWGPEREVRAGLIRWLCVDRNAASAIDPRGIQIHAARIVGPLDLSSVAVPFPLCLWRCYLTDHANLISSHLPALNLTGSRVRSIIADGASISGGLLLRYGFSAEAEVRLVGAQIGGDLDCNGGRFKNPHKYALVLDRVTVQDSVFLGADFSSEGAVRLRGAEIGGDLVCIGGTFKNLGGDALNAAGADVKGTVFLDKGFNAEGEVRLPGAHIGVNFYCSGGTFKNPPQKDVAGSGTALRADRVDVKGSLFLREGFTAEGEVRLLGAQIGGNLECTGGTFRNPPQKHLPGRGKALSADGAKVNGSVFLDAAFTAEGEVRLPGAQIGRDLDCSGGTFKNPPQRDVAGSGTALSADRVDVRGNIFLGKGFTGKGEVRLLAAQIGGSLECTGGKLSLLNAQGARISRHLFLRQVRGAENATIDLRNASADALFDDEGSWPAAGRLYLDGFVYGRISEGPTDAETRLKWLALQPEFKRQPYRQLAKALRESGDEDGAVTVLQEMERLRRKQTDWSIPTRVESGLLRWTIGYGYHPLWAFWELIGLSALGWILHRRSYLAGNIVPTDRDAYESFKRDGRPPAHYEGFAPLIYSAENSVPLIKLGQADKWQPAPSSESALSRLSEWPTSLGRRCTWTWFRWLQRLLVLCGLLPDPNPENRLRPFQRLLIWLGLQPHPNPEEKRSRLSRWFTSPTFLHWFLWIQILLGWLLATLFVAGVTGVVRRE